MLVYARVMQCTYRSPVEQVLFWMGDHPIRNLLVFEGDKAKAPWPIRSALPHDNLRVQGS